MSSSAATTAATAAAASGAVSLPLLALAEAKTHSVVIETRDGRSYRGILMAVDAENGNVSLGKNICTDKSGYKVAMNNTMIKGSEVTLVQLPAVIKNAPFLKADFIRSVKEKTRATTVAAGGGSLAQRIAKRNAAAASGAGAGESSSAGAGGDKPSSYADRPRARLGNSAELARRMKEARKGGRPSTGAKRRA